MRYVQAAKGEEHQSLILYHDVVGREVVGSFNNLAAKLLRYYDTHVSESFLYIQWIDDGG